MGRLAGSRRDDGGCDGPPTTTSAEFEDHQMLDAITAQQHEPALGVERGFLDFRQPSMASIGPGRRCESEASRRYRGGADQSVFGRLRGGRTVGRSRGSSLRLRYPAAVAGGEGRFTARPIHPRVLPGDDADRAIVAERR